MTGATIHGVEYASGSTGVLSITSFDGTSSATIPDLITMPTSSLTVKVQALQADGLDVNDFGIDADREKVTAIGVANLAVNCADFASEPTVAQVRQLQSQWRTKYPMFGASSAVGLLSCAAGEWPGKDDPYPTGKAAGAPPILVVGTTNDPATPYAGTAKLANMLGVGQVLTWQGEGHTAYPQTPCITNAVDSYLLNLQMPPKNTVCPKR